jgi:hypothetical protein
MKRAISFSGFTPVPGPYESGPLLPDRQSTDALCKATAYRTPKHMTAMDSNETRILTCIVSLNECPLAHPQCG